jgi:hypothetical protein
MNINDVESKHVISEIVLTPTPSSHRGNIFTTVARNHEDIEGDASLICKTKHNKMIWDRIKNETPRSIDFTLFGVINKTKLTQKLTI